MHLDYTLLGWLGLVCIHGSRLPQIYFMLKSKRASGLSLSGTAAVQLGLASYFVYALYQHDPVFITSNVVGFALQGVVLLLNWKWRERGSLTIYDEDSGFYWRDGHLHTEPVWPLIVGSLGEIAPRQGVDDPLNTRPVVIARQPDDSVRRLYTDRYYDDGEAQ